MTGAVLLAPRSARQAGIDKEAGRHLHLRCGIKAAFTGSDNRALHHDMPGVSERTCILYTSLVRQSREKGPNIGQVNPGLSSGGMAGWVFQEDINEGAPVKILRPKPIVKDVEDSKQLTGWRCRPAACFRF